MDITYTQCKQLVQNDPNLRDVVEAMNNQPEWITEELDIADIQAVIQGGCSSGAYMPAVTYYQATKTMTEHGDEVLEYIEEVLGELPAPKPETSWSGMAVYYLSTAVELWCSNYDEVLSGVNWD